MLLGWIKLHRQLLDNWIMTEPEALSVWVRFLLEANHDTKKKMLNGSLVEIKRGQLVFGLDAFSARSGVSIAKLRRYIKLLENDGMINRLKTAKYSIITIASFDSYQSLDRQTTSKEQSNDKQIATPKECKNEKNVKEVIAHLNLVVNAKYKHTTKSHSQNISARLDDGYSVDDLKLVINSKANEWLNDKTMAQYLRPSTLFQASKFQGYLTSAKPVSITNKPRGFTQ